MPWPKTAKIAGEKIAAKLNPRLHTELINDDDNSGRMSLFLLSHVAASLPGGVQTMVTLASLSRDDRVRAVAGRWTSLSRKAKQTVEIEQLCRVVGIDGAHFFGAISATAFELGMDVDFIGSIEDWVAQARMFPQRAMAARGARLREQFFKAAAFCAGESSGLASEPVSVARTSGRRGMSKRIDRGARAVSEEEQRRCSEITALRKQWRLSQSQFASLVISSTRTVRHWERGEFCPTPEQTQFLRHLAAYVQREGLRAFHKRFVREAPRYGGAGRPANIVRSLANSR